LFPDAELIPTAAKPRAKAIWYDEFADTILVAAAGKLFFNRIVAPLFLKIPGDLAAADKAEAEELPPILAYIEAMVPDSGFLVEDRLTLADLSVASPFVNLAHAGHFLDAAAYPRLAAYTAAILARPSFAGMVAAENKALGKD
jgi:glutathione S-transferase